MLLETRYVKFYLLVEKHENKCNFELKNLNNPSNCS